jgi:hypothetical protein
MKHFNKLVKFQIWIEEKGKDVLDSHPELKYITCEWNDLIKGYEIDFWNSEPILKKLDLTEFPIWVGDQLTNFIFLKQDEIAFDFPVLWEEFIFEVFA